MVTLVIALHLRCNKPPTRGNVPIHPELDRMAERQATIRFRWRNGRRKPRLVLLSTESSRVLPWSRHRDDPVPS